MRGENPTVQGVVYAARQAAFIASAGGRGYRAMIKRKARNLKKMGKPYEALLLLKKIGE